MKGIKINRLEIENVKRIKAVKLEPSANGLTIIGGNNNQGKTSVLDAIAWALGGEKYRPGNAVRDGSTIPPNLHIVMSNGLIVERKGKNSTLTVTDPNGGKAGQQLLNEFVTQLALDLPKFIHSTDKEKANILLQIIGVGQELAKLEQQEKEAYDERLAIGRIADQKEKFAKEQPYAGAVRLITKWCYPLKGKHQTGEYKITKPDTDNMIKLLKDEMTKAHFWKDDAQVASEVTEKFWAEIPGIYVRLEEV